YVASFMGYRNLLAVQARGTGGDQVTVTGPGMELTGLARQAIDSGQAVVAIRPEDFTVTVTGDNALQVTALQVVVEVVEYHGREQAVQGRLPGGQEIRLRSVERLAPGDKVTVCVPPDKVLVFAADRAP